MSKVGVLEELGLTWTWVCCEYIEFCCLLSGVEWTVAWDRGTASCVLRSGERLPDNFTRLQDAKAWVEIYVSKSGGLNPPQTPRLETPRSTASN
jgi:hypothetical protein